MWFSQNHKEHWYARFLGLKKTHQWINFLAKPRSPILEEFLDFLPQVIIFWKIGLISFWHLRPFNFRVRISDSRFADQLCLFANHLKQFFVKFANQNFPSVRISAFRETTKFLFAPQACHIFTYLKLQTNTPKSSQTFLSY